MDFIAAKVKQRLNETQRLQQELTNLDDRIDQLERQLNYCKLLRINAKDDLAKLENKITLEVIYFNSKIGDQDENT